jgi:hypothetical protein
MNCRLERQNSIRACRISGGGISGLLMRLPRDLRFKNSGADKLGLKQSTAADLTRKLYQIDQGRPWRPVSRKANRPQLWTPAKQRSTIMSASSSGVSLFLGQRYRRPKHRQANCDSLSRIRRRSGTYVHSPSICSLNTDERKMCGFAASVYAMLSPTIVL